MENDLLKSQLEIDVTATRYLLEIAKWAKFLSVVGFIICGLISTLGIFFSAFIGFFTNRYTKMNLAGLGGVFAVVYIIIAIFLFIPNLFLFRFATKMKTALLSSDQLTLNESLNQHRRYYKFIGICTAIVLCFYALIFILAIIGNLFK